jgi:hypothetical protein
MLVENTHWRNDCESNYPSLYCVNPYECETCKMWNCDDIYEKTVCAMNDLDSDNSGYINL